MEFNRWYEKNKERLTTMTFEYAIRTAFMEGQLSQAASECIVMSVDRKQEWRKLNQDVR